MRTSARYANDIKGVGAGVIVEPESRGRPVRGGLGAGHGLFPFRRAVTHVNGRNAPRALPGDEIVGRRGEHQFRVDQDVTGGDLAVMIRQELDLPFARCVFHGRCRADDAIDVLAIRRAAVELLELLGERACGLLLQQRRDALDPRELLRMEVDKIAAGGEGRILQRLEVGAHVFDDSIDQIARRTVRPGRGPRVRM